MSQMYQLNRVELTYLHTESFTEETTLAKCHISLKALPAPLTATYDQNKC